MNELMNVILTIDKVHTTPQRALDYHIMIHMNQYSICINDTFCLLLDQKNLICPNILWDFWIFIHQNTLHLSKNISFEELFC